MNTTTDEGIQLRRNEATTMKEIQPTRTWPDAGKAVRTNVSYRGSLATMTVLGLGFLACPSVALTQDTRHVTEPKIPPSCVVLPAGLVTQGGTLAESDERRPDTARIQQALDHCEPSHAVELKSDGSHGAFLTGPLDLRQGVTLLVDRNVLLFASRNPRDYDIEPGVCGTVSPKGHDCKALLTGDHIDNAAIMGDGIIDGRGGSKLLGQDLTWWDVADKALKGGLQNNFRMLTLTRCNNFTLYRIQFKDSPNFHVTFTGGDGFTVWGIVINAPANARNLDGIDLGQPYPPVPFPHHQCHGRILLYPCGRRHSRCEGSRHLSDIPYLCHAQPLLQPWHVDRQRDYRGVSALRVSDLTIDGADSGIRIKSNVTLGGYVHDVEYDDVCIRDSPNPIIINSHYDSYGLGHEVYGTGTNHLPIFQDIRFNHVVVEGGKLTLDGLDNSHRLEMSLHDVYLAHPESNKLVMAHAAIHVDGSNITGTGDDVSFSGNAAGGTRPDCAGKFVPFPAEITRR